MSRVRRSIYTPRPEIDVRWQEHAACADAPTALFFPDAKPDAPEWKSPRLRAYVQEILEDYCAACPVRRDCLTHAMTEPERDGIWGGFSPLDRLHADHPNQLLPAQEAHTA